MIIDDLVYDRTQDDVDLVRALNAIGWDNMTAEQKSQWRGEDGSPLYATDGVLEATDGVLYVSDGGTLVRGAYNYTDLNRVEGAVQYISDMLVSVEAAARAYAASLGVAWGSIYSYPYDPDDYDSYTVKTDWGEDDIPTSAQMTRYLNNVKSIKNAIAASYPALPGSMGNLTFTGANAIERTLYTLYNALVATDERITAMITHTAESWVYSGQPYSGMIWAQFS